MAVRKKFSLKEYPYAQDAMGQNVSQEPPLQVVLLAEDQEEFFINKDL